MQDCILSIVHLYGVYILPRILDIIEKVQRRATKLLSAISHLPYETLLVTVKLSLYSLYCRHQRGDLIETLKY